jgi:signal transduction histidine kinase
MPAIEQWKRLRTATFSFWLLLLYIVAALVWWYITLEQQNKEIAETRIGHNTATTQPAAANNTPGSINEINNLRKRRSIKHAGEGVIFLVIIFLGAAYVYRAVKRQLTLSRQQQDFMMAVTHELKTPLAIGRLNIETLQKRKLSEEQQQRLLQNTLAEMQRLNDLTTNILVISQLDAGAYKLNNEAIHFSSLLTSVLADFGKQYPDCPLVTNIEKEVFAYGETGNI